MICNVFNFAVNLTHVHYVADYLRHKQTQQWWRLMKNLSILNLLARKIRRANWQNKLDPDPFILHSNWSDDASLLTDITYPNIFIII